MRETADDFAAAAEAFCKSLASSGLELLTRMFEGLEAAFSGVHEGTDDLYLASGLELVRAWQDNAQYDCLDDSFSAQQDRYFPQP